MLFASRMKSIAGKARPYKTGPYETHPFTHGSERP